MRKAEEAADWKCPLCGKMENQVNAGKNRSGSPRCFCKACKKYYTLHPKTRNCPEEVRQQAIKTFYAGAGGRGVGKLFGFSKANVYNRIKKAIQTKRKKETQTDIKTAKLDELYWFLERKSQTKTRENVYIITMVSRKPRQIMGYRVSRDKSAETIQRMVDTAPTMKTYYTDVYCGYLNIIFPGKHIYNIHNKKDTFTVEGVNADLRHYIPTSARHSRGFPRKLENLQAVVAVFVAAYNRFGIQKERYRSRHPDNAVHFSFYFSKSL